MQLAYVAGPYRGTSKIKLINKLQVIHNILAARKVAKELWKLGYAVICPHLNGALMDGIVPDQAFLDGDLLMLDRCDLLVLQGKWHKSSGTIGEVKRAQTLEMPVFEWHGKLVQVDTLSDTVNMLAPDEIGKECRHMKAKDDVMEGLRC